MNARRPPPVALFLLTHVVLGPRRESLAGDLLEQFQAGRSRMWFWRQTLAAVATSLAVGLRHNKALAVRAFVVGWAAFVVGAMVANRLTVATRGRLIAYFSDHGIYSEDLFFWSSQLPSITFSYVACGMTGWLIARWHRHAPSTFLLFAATVFLFEYGIAAWMLANAPGGQEGPRGQWVLLLALIGRPIALLAGGLAGFARSPVRIP